MRTALKIGFSFGLTSGVITTLGLMVGLHAGTHSMPAVLGGILTIAVADAMSDALGIHVAEESKTMATPMTFGLHGATFAAKFVIAGTFAVPVLFMPLDAAVVVSLIWGLSLLAVLSYALCAGTTGASLESHRRARAHRTQCRGDHPLSRSVGAGDVRIRVADEGDAGGVEIQTQLPKVGVGRRCGRCRPIWAAIEVSSAKRWMRN